MAHARRMTNLENTCSEHIFLDSSPQSKFNRPKRHRPGSIPAHYKSKWIDKLMANEETHYEHHKSHRSNKAGSVSKISSSLRQERVSPPKQQLFFHVRESTACPQLCPSPPPRGKRNIKEKMSPPEHFSTLPKPQEAQLAFLPQDSTQLLPSFHERAGAGKRIPQKNEARHRSLTTMKEQKYSSIKSKISNKGIIPVRASPDKMLALPAAVKYKITPGEHVSHLKDGNETTSVKETDLKEDVSSSSVGLSKIDISTGSFAGSENFASECPYHKEFECTHRKDYSDIDSRKDMEQADCDLQHRFISTNICEILPTQHNFNSKQAHYSDDLEISHLITVPLQSSVRNMRCAEASKQVASRCARDISGEAVREQETNGEWNKVRGLPQRSHVTDGTCKLNDEVRHRRTKSATLPEKNQVLQKNIKFAGDFEERIKPRPHSHSMHVSDSPTHIDVAHEERQRHNRKYDRKPTYRISVESKESRSLENFRSPVARQNSLVNHESNFKDNGCLKRLNHVQQTCINRREKEDSTYSGETMSHHLQESKTYLNQKISRSKVRAPTRKRLFPRARSANRVHRPKAHSILENLSDFTLDKSPHINRKELSLSQEPVIGKHIKKENLQDRELDNSSAILSIPTLRSDTDISKDTVKSGDKKRIFLTVGPAPRLSQQAFTTSQKISPTFPEEQKLVHISCITSGLFGAESSSKVSNIPEYSQKHLPSKDEASLRDKVISIMHWLETTSLSKFRVQNNEDTSPDNIAGYNTECPSTSMGTKLNRENTHSSLPNNSVNIKNESLLGQKTTRGRLRPRIPSSSLPEYFNFFKSAASGSFPNSKPSADGSCDATLGQEILNLDDSTLLPAVDEGSPKKMAALTAAGLRLCSRRMSKSQGFKHRRSSIYRRGWWTTCLLNFCALIVALELLIMAFFCHKDMMPMGRIVFGSVNSTDDTSRQNLTNESFSISY